MTPYDYQRTQWIHTGRWMPEDEEMRLTVASERGTVDPTSMTTPSTTKQGVTNVNHRTSTRRISQNKPVILKENRP